MKIRNTLILLFCVFALSVAGCGNQEAEENNTQGIALYEEGNYNQALQAFTKAVSLDKNNAGYLTNLGLTQIELGDYEQAAVSLAQALDSEKNNPWVYRALGILAIKKERFEEAIAYFSNAKERGADNAELLKDILQYEAEAKLLSGDLKGALSTIDEYIQADPASGVGHFLKGRTYLAGGDKEEAIRSFYLMTEANALDREYYFSTYALLEEYGLLDEGRDVMARASGVSGTDVQTVSFRGKVAFLLEDYERVVSELESVKAQLSEESLYQLASAYTKLDRPADAFAIYTQLEQAHPEDGWLGLQIGIYYLNQKDYAQAAEKLMQAQTKAQTAGDEDTVKETAYYHAIALEYQGQYAAALEEFRAYAEKYGEDEGVKHEIIFLESRV